jgi:mannose-6-phosphate isomerase-like protein (cupin superfamily)
MASMLTEASPPAHEAVCHNGRTLAVIISNRFHEPGVHFFTDDSSSLQLGSMSHQAGKSITPHLHNPVPRQALTTQEVIFIRKGKLRVDFYDESRAYLESRMLEAGDVILLIEGGHGFQVIEDVELFEVKQGPYLGEKDKTRFDAEPPSEVEAE